MQLIPAQADRASAVLLGTGIGDALGVPYEFQPRLGPEEVPVMKGGGLGNYEPGEWSDDTSMAMAIAEAVAGGHDLTSEEGLDAVARGFMRWYTDFDGNPPDIGNQTRAVLSATYRRLKSDPTATACSAMFAESQVFATANPHSAGNGALMRTGPVALAHLDDRETLAEAARAVASLTHADELAGDSCVLWSEAIRVAIIEGRIDIQAGFDLISDERRSQWRSWLADATTQSPSRFTPNGFTVTALQAAASSILHTPADDGPTHVRESLYTAIRIGDDTDTVAAIAGGLLGARWGREAFDDRWTNTVHGWPMLDGHATAAIDLAHLPSRRRPKNGGSGK
ncbi:ADP-ribosylglycohydrolase family protein [Gordonia aichiensis]|uniref:Putative hydrolase n=1 Tax=Gordonia aichiensis NBRC 108223 TaxID=1220583 RepID=L7KNP0_9ACTN|nr:ADP-ribosylglycohydrolase family protein [Gordonia aichiensis]GAC49328.1 putative hydrolase [Gordonia aichiensis NBRC 108223]